MPRPFSKTKSMKEEFLHYLWKTQRFDMQRLFSVCGKKIELVSFGQHNDSDGPDFLDACLRIDNILWRGNVEMHLQSKQWYQHAHDDDPAYDNVILHVVIEDNRPVYNRHGHLIPTLEMKKRIPQGMDRTYRRLLAQQSWIPCHSQFQSVPTIFKQSMLDKLLIERLERKTTFLNQLLIEYQMDWEQAFFIALCKNLGSAINAAPFEALAKSIPLKVLLRHRDRLPSVEALLFGQAGMLEQTFTDAYPKKLQTTFDALKNQYSLNPIPVLSWKYLRMRPPNFPTIRLAQIARLIHQSNHLFSKILAVTSATDIYNMFDITISNYWRTHYVFDKSSAPRKKKLGKSTIQLLIINTIVPFLFLYGKRKDDAHLLSLAIQLLSSLPPENNHLITGWKKLHLIAENAQQSQALLELKKEYCDKKRCLDCKIGHEVLKGGKLKEIRLRR